jgi:hypothetical protein
MFVLSACNQALTVEEAQEALDESAVATQALSLSSSSVELVIETDFTIGQAVQKAAEEVKEFITSQLPCAEITLSDATLEVEYGVNPGECTYNGHRYSGTHQISVERNEENDILIHHEWTDFSNTRLKVSGSADVTWSLEDRSRHVVHELRWERIIDGKRGTGSGDRVQTALPGGILEGIKVEGERAWRGDQGEWELDVDDIEMRWVDPVPQSGTWELLTPFDDKTLSLSFERVENEKNTIRVLVESGRRSFEFDVVGTGSGAIRDAD